jgi:HD-GYP domain-containing protein (c-di-GMP phosphodiesterase class II)
MRDHQHRHPPRGNAAPAHDHPAEDHAAHDDAQDNGAREGATPEDGASGAAASRRSPPASEGGRALSLAALRALIAAIAQRRLYPPQHPIAARSLQSLQIYLERILTQAEEWRLAVVGQRLVVGDHTIDEHPEILAPFVADLAARGAETILFRRGLGPEELGRFITLMILDPRAFAGTSFSDRMATEGIQAIEVGRLLLEEPSEEERAEAARQQTGSDIAEVYSGAVDFIQTTILGFREGRKISLSEAEDFVQTMIRQIQEDRSPLLILSTLKSHHPYTFTHIINVCILTLAQVEALGADRRLLRHFGLASMLHDIGKSLVPAEVLSKPGSLTPEEFALVARHPQDGVHILRETSGVPDLALLVALEHHMRYNHQGYPRLKHVRPLHPCSLMTNLADTYDAMRSRRAYQAEFAPEKVAALLTERSGKDFDPHLTRAFMQIMGAYPPGTRVRIDSGEEGMVVRVNPSNPYRPVVRLLKSSRGEVVSRMEIVDLADKEPGSGRFARTILSSITSAAQPTGAGRGTPGGPGAGN